MKFDLSLLSDPQAVAIGTLPPHSDHRWFASAMEALSGDSSYEQSLDGLWKFDYSRNPQGAPFGFERPDFDVSTWDDIRVPGHIQLAGYDRPQYVNTQYPWDGQEDIVPPQAPTRFNPTACYVKDFHIERPRLAGDRVTVTFDGAETGIAVWFNGHYLGYAEDSFTPSEFDLTDYLQDGVNRLAVKVFKWTSASWIEDQDFYRFSGLFRSVTLRTYPKAHVRDIRVGVTVAPDLRLAEINVVTEISGDADVRVTLAGRSFTSSDGCTFSLQLDDPHLWSAEDPYLYQAHMEVFGAGGELTQYIPLSIGVRRFGIEDGILKINGERVVFLGVNRHEFGLAGRVMTSAQIEADLISLKRAGLNAIRTSHYPNDTSFYHLADKYGFYVIDEMNLESHGLWDRIRSQDAPVSEAVPGDKPEWLPALLGRAEGMYQRDKNHPSIVIWSCGNESFGGKDLLAVSEYFRSHDSRPVHYEGVFWDDRYPQTTDIRSEMYTPAAEVERRLQEHRDKPMILCEYAHAMGNSFGSVERYLDLAYREPLFQGGFIWDFADQALAMKDRYGNEYFGYGGDSGEAPHDNEFCGNGIFFADHSPTPRMQEVKYLHQSIRGDITRDQVILTNRFNFTSTGQFDATVRLSREGRVLAEAELETNVCPGETVSYPLPVTIPTEPGEYAVDLSFTLREKTAWAEAGFEIAHEQQVFEVAAETPRLATIAAPAFKVTRGIHNFGVAGEHFSVLFSRLHGGLQSYRYGMTADGGRELLRAIPLPNFWHAPTSNETAWGGPFEDGQWLLASRYSKFEATPTNPALVELDDRVIVTYTYVLPTVPESTCLVSYEVDGNGKVGVTVTLDPGSELPSPPEFGMLFKVDADYSELTWYGEGPEESYCDRRLGARLDVYRRRVADQLTPYLRPQEAGNHTEVRWAEVTTPSGRGLRFEAPTPMDFSALPWTPDEIEAAAHPNELPPIHHTFIRPALARRGVGGDDTWGARPHPEFLLPGGEMVFRFSFQGML